MQAFFYVPCDRQMWVQNVCEKATNDVVKFELVCVKSAVRKLLKVSYFENDIQFVTGFLRLAYAEDRVENIEKMLVYGEYLDAVPWQMLWTDPRNIVTAPQAFATMLDYFDTCKSTSDWLQEVKEELTIT